jgi:hypothetical protein
VKILGAFSRLFVYFYRYITGGGMMRFFVFTLIISASILFAQQAIREHPDSTDRLNINPLNGLRYIELSIEKSIFDQKGIDKKASDAFYFRVEGDEDYTKVSYFGNNLSDYVINVEPAYNIMASYRNLKIAHSGLFWGGIALASAGAVSYAANKDISPLIFVGLGTFSISWIPEYFSHDKIPEAIGVYNQSIGKFQASSSINSHIP